MQKSRIISYNRDDFYLIKDQSYKAGHFIGKIKSLDPNEVNLIIYIFPEDTKEGRKQYMSKSEVFLTDNILSYKFTGDETQVMVTDFNNYINKKYIKKEDASFLSLYFYRQKYLENGSFEPGLQKICYCKQYLNPDYVFKICKCGSFFHPICFMLSEKNKCWNENCSIDCSIFFPPKEVSNIKTNIVKSHIKPTNYKYTESKAFIMNNNKYNNRENYKYADNVDFKDNQRNNKQNTLDKYIVKSNKKENEDNTQQESFNNDHNSYDYRSKDEKRTDSQNKSKIKMLNSIIYKKNAGEGYQFRSKKEPNSSERERAYKIISDNLKNGIEYLKKNPNIIDDFIKIKPNLKEKISLIKDNNESLIKNICDDLAKSIEYNLFNNCEQKTNRNYFIFLREFSLLVKNSPKILIRLIVGDLTSEEISKFKGDDFLTDEQRKEKEELKYKEIQKIIYKEPLDIKATSNKGIMLTEIQDNIDDNKINYDFNTKTIMNSKETPYKSEYRKKLDLMKEENPNISENDIIFLVESKDPNEEEIQLKLNSIIQENLNLEEQKELFIFRRNKLKKKAERYFKKFNDKNDKKLLEQKIKDYMQFISFDIKI